MYPQIDFWRFLIGLGVVAIPAALMERAGNERDAMRYVGLILLMLIVTNWRGLVALEGFLRRELS